MSWYDSLELTASDCYSWQNLFFYLPLHGNYQFALRVRDLILKEKIDALAIPLPSFWKETLETAISALPKPSLLLKDDQYLLVEPIEAVIEAIRLAKIQKIPIFYYSPWGYPPPLPGNGQTPDLLLSHVGNALYYNLFQPKTHPDLKDNLYFWYSAGHLNALQPFYQKILTLVEPRHFKPLLEVLPFGGEPQDHPQPPQIETVAPPLSIYNYCSGEFPMMAALYEKHRLTLRRNDLLYPLLFTSFNRFLNRYLRLNPLNAQQIRLILDFSHRLAFQRMLTRPDLFTLVKSVRAIIDEETAFHFLRWSSRSPWNQTEETEEDPDHEDQWNAILNNNIVNALPYPRHFSRLIRFRLPPTRKQRQEWSRLWNRNQQVSYQPEDIIIENFRQYIFQNAFQIAQIQQPRIEEFTSSFKDGLAFRETIRDYHKRKLYVKEIPMSHGKLGAKIIIFDADISRYPHRLTWYAEHPHESTLCFYSTQPESELVGPGISRCHYGGLLMIYPPRTIPDIWQDPWFNAYTDPIERLVLAGILYSTQKYIALIAGKSPPTYLKHWASQAGKHLIFIPIQSFSRQKIEKIRIFHILSGHDVRHYADRFID